MPSSDYILLGHQRYAIKYLASYDQLSLKKLVQQVIVSFLQKLVLGMLIIFPTRRRLQQGLSVPS